MTNATDPSRRNHLGLIRGLLALAFAFGVLSAPAHAAGGGAGTGAKATTSSKNYDYYLTGSPVDATPAAPITPMVVLMGGGVDVDDAFMSMIAKARNGGTGKVDIVIVRASGADGYNPYLFAMDGVDSVETLVVKTRAGADDSTVNAIVSRADVLFIAGGDQWNYINLWKGSKLDATLQVLSARNVPMGGTSAGLAVLGAVDFSAENGTITSDEATGNPYHRRLTLDAGFLNHLPYLAGTIADPHLVTRDRMGRLLTFVARMLKDGVVDLTSARAIGVDEQTALVIDGGGAGTGTVMGVGAVYFLKPSIAATTIVARTPLTFLGIGVYKLTANTGTFAFGIWAPTGNVPLYNLDVVAGVLTSSQGGGSPY
ncbi:MAG: cyanophycinase [Pseudomonadota bacterium]|nr:cyanophycinase [Pseudomonadota bacterium]